MMTTSEPGLTDEEILAHKRQFAREYHGPRVTPERVLSLSPNEIFVFGSNASGFHGGGAAAQAMHDFGAIWGQGEGLQGRSWWCSSPGHARLWCHLGAG